MRVETAIKMIENHGLKAFVTPEGLACVCEVHFGLPTKHAQSVAFLDDDCVFEEITTLRVRSVSSQSEYDYVLHSEVMDWLGY